MSAALIFTRRSSASALRLAFCQTCRLRQDRRHEPGDLCGFPPSVILTVSASVSQIWDLRFFDPFFRPFGFPDCSGLNCIALGGRP